MHSLLPLRPFSTFVLGLACAGVTHSQGPVTVRAQHKVSLLEGGFLGPLKDGDRFGGALARLGDLDGNGTRELAVGTPSGDAGGLNTGAVYLLFLASDGSVTSQLKISNNRGGFGDLLEYTDAFGSGIACPGDVDGDGIDDLAVGVPGDDGPPFACGLALSCDYGGYWVLFLQADGSVRSAVLNGSFPLFAQAGSALAAPGDLDLDGVPDLALGIPGLNGDAGGVQVVLLRSDGTPRANVLIAQESGGFGGNLSGSGRFGASLAALGDLDGNGANDLAIGEPAADRVWIVFLAPDGTVLGQQEIGPQAAGLRSGLGELVRFGGSLTLVDDLDEDGLGELGVGAYLDDDGGPDRGAFWVLGLNPDGTVDSRSKISSSAGGFTGTLDDEDWFGFSAAGLGDLDGDGAPEVACGTPKDDDGGPDRGAFWILSLEPEQAGCGRAQAVLRNGENRNPENLSCTALPVLGGVAELQLDCTAHRRGACQIYGRGGPLSGMFTGRGEVLIDRTHGVMPFHLVDHSGSGRVATFRLAIPSDLALCGQVIYVQGACNGAPGAQLSNAVDLILGQ